MTFFIPRYSFDFQLKEFSLLRLNFSTSEIFNADEIDIISQFYELREDDKFKGCGFNFKPRQIKINYTNQQWLQFTNPFRPGTQQYIDFLDDVKNTNQFSSYEIIPERVPYSYLFDSFRYG